MISLVVCCDTQTVNDEVKQMKDKEKSSSASLTDNNATDTQVNDTHAQFTHVTVSYQACFN